MCVVVRGDSCLRVLADYVDINPQAKTTLLFLHGWPGLWASWKYQIEAFQVIAAALIPISLRLSVPLRTITGLLPPIFEVSAHQHTQAMSGRLAQCPTWSATYCVFWSMLGLQEQSPLGTLSVTEIMYQTFG